MPRASLESRCRLLFVGGNGRNRRRAGICERESLELAVAFFFGAELPEAAGAAVDRKTSGARANQFPNLAKAPRLRPKNPGHRGAIGERIAQASKPNAYPS